MKIGFDMNFLRKLSGPAALVLLAIACGPGLVLTPSPTPAPTTPPSSTPTPLGPTPRPPTAYTLPSETGAFPLDLELLGPDNVGRMEPFRALRPEGVQGSIDAASLAFPVAYEFELAGLLDDGQLIIWNMATAGVSYQDQEATGARHSGQHPALAVSTGFQGYLATGAKLTGIGETQAILVRSVEGGLDPLAFSGASDAFDPDEVAALAFSPDGHLLAAGLAAGGEGLVRIWDVRDDDDLQLFADVATDQPVRAVQFTPDNAGLVVSAGDALIMLEPGTGSELQRRSFDFTIRGHTIGPSGESLAVWGDELAVLEAPGRTEPLEIPAAGELRRVDFSPDEQLAVLVDGDRLRLWNLEAGVEVVSLSRGDPFLDARFFEDGRVLATIDQQARVLLWGVRSAAGLPEDRAVVSAANAGQLTRVARLYAPNGPDPRFLFDGNRLTVGTFHSVSVLDLPSLEVQQQFPRAERSGTVYSNSPDGRRIAWVGNDGLVKVWNLDGDRPDLEFSPPGQFCCMQLLFTPEGRHLITVNDRSARVWDLQSGDEIHGFERVDKVHVAPDGSRLGLQQGLEVNLIDFQSGQVVRSLTGFETAAPVVNTEFSADWEVMVWTSRATMQFSDVESGALGPAVPFSWGRFSPLGDRIAAVEDGWILETVGEVHEIDMHSGETLRVFDHQEDAIVDALAYSPDGRLLASATELSVRIWDAQTGEQLFTLPDAPEGVYGLAFSPDQRLLVTVSSGSQLEFWAVPADS